MRFTPRLVGMLICTSKTCQRPSETQQNRMEPPTDDQKRCGRSREELQDDVRHECGIDTQPWRSKVTFHSPMFKEIGSKTPGRRKVESRSNAKAWMGVMRPT